MQKNWIGKSVGAEINFKIISEELEIKESNIKIYTTRPDTIVWGNIYCNITSTSHSKEWLSKKIKR